MTAKAWTYRYRFRPVRVVDGDGIVGAIDCGLRVTMVLPLRLAGCNAAEKTTPEGLAATAFVDQWVKDHADRDGWLAVITGKNPGDNYGRWLAEVQSIDGLHDLTDDLIAAGHAVAWNGRGDKPTPADPAPVALARHAQRPSRRRVIALVALVLVDVALWCAAFTAAWRHERDSADRVVSGTSSR